LSQGDLVLVEACRDWLRARVARREGKQGTAKALEAAAFAERQSSCRKKAGPGFIMLEPREILTTG
jgi:hypothetical protein